jgi:hypothetical protein
MLSGGVGWKSDIPQIIWSYKHYQNTSFEVAMNLGYTTFSDTHMSYVCLFHASK